jgi:hypothetical protein
VLAFLGTIRYNESYLMKRRDEMKKKLQQDMYELFLSGWTLDKIAVYFGLSVTDVYESIRELMNK